MMKKYTKEEQTFIEGTEFALDWGFPISDEDFKKYTELIEVRGDNMNEDGLYRTYIQLNTTIEVEEFTNICSQIPEEIILKGKDENGCDWSLSAKSVLCSLVMTAKLQKFREHTAHEVDWNTIYVECEKDIYSLISKFVRE